MFKDHKNIDAVKYCEECKIYMCNKCSIHHQGLCERHIQYELNKDLMNIFTDKCEEKNHPNKLEFYCKNHNKLCCAFCITKLKVKGNGQHKDCDIDCIENIKEEKKNKLKNNIEYLENLSKDLNNTINELKILFEKINGNKEELKLKVQKIFTNFRNTLNEREDELLLEVDEIFNNKYCDEKIIKDYEKLPNKIKSLLEKSKLINDEWNDNNKLNYLINMCIDLERNIETINLINNNVKKCKLNQNKKIEFNINNEISNKIIENIKDFGKININTGLVNKIIKNEDEANELSEFLFKEKIIKFNLLYQATRDGDKISDIINKIEGYSPTLFLIYTKKGVKCGGYTKALWKADSNYKYDDSAFLFNFNNKKIFKVKNPNESIYCINEGALVFGNYVYSDYYIPHQFMSQKIFENKNKSSYYSNNYDIQGENESQINELEIYECNDWNYKK